jgi:hypothetical protein
MLGWDVYSCNCNESGDPKRSDARGKQELATPQDQGMQTDIKGTDPLKL